MRRFVRDSLLVGLLSGMLPVAAYCAAAVDADSRPVTHLGFSHGSDDNAGYLNLIAPVPETLPGGFLDFRFIGSSSESREFNLGFGRRSYLRSGSALLGAYLFYDRRRSAHGNSFDQLTTGVDYLSTALDARINVYMPRKKSAQIGLGDPYLGQNGIMRDALYEEAQPGFDLELGTPVPYLSRWLESRVFVGWAEFDGNRTVDAEGMTARIEFHPNAALRLSASTRDDDPAGRRNFVELRLSVPVSEHFWRDLRNAFCFRPGTQRSLAQRRYSPPLRDIDVVTRQAVRRNLIQPLVYVDNRLTGSDPDGSLEQPYGSIQQAVDAAGAQQWVYVAGGGSDYTEQVVLRTGQTLLGSGYNYLGIGSGVYPVIRGGAVQLTMASNTSVQGFQFNNPVSMAIAVTNSENVVIRNNRIDATISRGQGISVTMNDGQAHQNLLIEGNYTTWNTFGVQLNLSGGSSLTDVVIRDNQIENSFFGLYASNSGQDLETVVERNTLQPWFAGAWLAQPAGASRRTVADFGGGSLGSIGYNRLLSGTGYLIGGSNDVVKTARFNWWGQASGPLPGQTNGVVDTSNWLTQDPLP